MRSIRARNNIIILPLQEDDESDELLCRLCFLCFFLCFLLLFFLCFSFLCFFRSLSIAPPPVAPPSFCVYLASSFRSCEHNAEVRARTE
jgi:tellurite resistance protein TehA-like permease